MNTLNRGFALFGILAFALFVMACSDASADGAYEANQPALDPVETFTEDDAPKTLVHDGRQFKSPWGYEKSGNAKRSYPLLVSGCWGEGQGEYSAISQKHPAFVIDYQKNGTQDGSILADWIDSAIADGYRIDQTRVYLTGFSQGGSGSYPLAQGMHAKGKYFAAIIRVAGQSQSDIGNAIAERTAVWYHIGLEDTDQRVQVARNALKNFRAYPSYANAVETTSEDTVTGMERTTVTLTRGGIPSFKYSEYPTMNHTPGPCYDDPELFEWMFRMRLRP
jgi:hypothetical protein